MLHLRCSALYVYLTLCLLATGVVWAQEDASQLRRRRQSACKRHDGKLSFESKPQRSAGTNCVADGEAAEAIRSI